MLEAMSRLALDFLREQLKADKDSDPWEWYLEAREQPELARYFLEPARKSMAPNYYVLRPDSEASDIAILEQREFISETSEALLPWFKIPGPMSGDASVTKRNINKGPGPKVTKQTFTRLKDEAEGSEAWSQHFRDAYDTFNRKKVRFNGAEHEGGNALDIAIGIIPEDRSTCLLTFENGQGLLPGQDKSYARYLNEKLPLHKYTTKESPTVDGESCSLCSRATTLYPNALPGAGLNLSNADRAGVFPGLNKKHPWKKFALCAPCADLLFVFSYRVQSRFIGRVAGGKALLIPYTTIDPAKRKKFMEHTRTYIQTSSEGQPIVRQEDRLLRLADEEDAITTITIIWAEFGQVLDNVSGIVSDILPSRLRAISEVSNEVREMDSPAFPELPIGGDLDIAFNHLGQLLRRPGGKRTEKVNNGTRLFDLRRDIAANAYHGREIPTERFWEEVREISEAYLIDALKSGSFGLINEGVSKKGDRYLTMAGWVRHLCKFIYFLRRLEVYPRMEDWRYEAQNERLKEFFTDSEGRTGIDSPEKAYAFLLGALFGKLIQVQAGRGVNVGSNALTWLRRLTLSGRDLPELYVRVREKLLTYGTESNANVREAIEELGHLGRTLGMDIKLSQTETGYFLLLGQSLSRTIMPARTGTEVKGDA